MTPDQIRKLDNVFRAVFELSGTVEVTSVSQMTQDNWDSLRHVTLVTAIENEFKISIDTVEALSIKSYESTRQLLEERGA